MNDLLHEDYLRPNEKSSLKKYFIKKMLFHFKEISQKMHLKKYNNFHETSETIFNLIPKLCYTQKPIKITKIGFTINFFCRNFSYVQKVQFRHNELYIVKSFYTNLRMDQNEFKTEWNITSPIWLSMTTWINRTCWSVIFFIKLNCHLLICERNKMEKIVRISKKKLFVEFNVTLEREKIIIFFFTNLSSSSLLLFSTYLFIFYAKNRTVL